MPTPDIIRAYPYVQFSDDENICAWFDAFNTYAQQYLDWFNNTPLAIYTNANIKGDLLDWVANGVYGVYRTPIAYGNSRSIGPLNTYTPNELPFNQGRELSHQTSFTMTDDIFKRVITWNFYKGDGLQMSIPWLKRRVARWMGLSIPSVSVSVNTLPGNVISITVTNGDSFSFNALQSVINNNLVNIPFGYTFSLSYINPSVFDTDFGGDIL